MELSNTVQWLYENSGPVIRLRRIRELGMDPAAEQATLSLTRSYRMYPVGSTAKEIARQKKRKRIVNYLSSR